MTENPTSNTPSPDSYESDFWIKYMTGPRQFKRAEPIHKSSSTLIKYGIEKEPSIFGQAKDSYRTPSSIQWLKEGKLYNLDVQTGMGIISIFSTTQIEGTSGTYDSTRETVTQMDDDDFKDAVQYLSRFEDIQTSKLLVGIDKRRIDTHEENQRNLDKKNKLYKNLDLRKKRDEVWEKIKESQNPDELDNLALEIHNIMEELSKTD